MKTSLFAAALVTLTLALSLPLASQSASSQTDPLLAELKAIRGSIEQYGQIHSRLALIDLQTSTALRVNAGLQQQIAVVAAKREGLLDTLRSHQGEAAQLRRLAGDAGTPPDERSRAEREVSGVETRIAALKLELNQIEQQEHALRLAESDGANAVAQAQHRLREVEDLLRTLTEGRR